MCLFAPKSNCGVNAPVKRWIRSAFCRDTAGQERFRTITTAYYRGAMVILPFALLATASFITEEVFLKPPVASQGIMLVYDISNEKSFENIKNWIRNIEEVSAVGAVLREMMCGREVLSVILGPFDVPQHASSDVEKMVLGNKCDMTDRRQVSKDRGEKVRRFGQSGSGAGLVRVKVVGLIFDFLSFSWPSIMG